MSWRGAVASAASVVSLAAVAVGFRPVSLQADPNAITESRSVLRIPDASVLPIARRVTIAHNCAIRGKPTNTGHTSGMRSQHSLLNVCVLLRHRVGLPIRPLQVPFCVIDHAQ